MHFSHGFNYTFAGGGAYFTIKLGKNDFFGQTVGGKPV